MSSLIQSLHDYCGIKSFYNTSFRKIPFHLQKNIPENFLVNEILPDKSIASPANDFGEAANGLFIHCLLQKRLIDTPGAVKLLSKELHIPNEWIGYAGLKDAKGITYQRISIFNSHLQEIKNLQFNNFSLSHFKRKKYEVNLGDLWGNRFTITLNKLPISESHDLSPEEITSSLQNFQNALFPNFFGLQRFGGSRPVSHLLGKYILKKDFEKAVKTYLTTISEFESDKVTQLRKNLAQNWDYKAFLEQIPKNFHYEIVLAKSLVNNPNNYFKALNGISLRMRKLFVNSYQSYIFNELLSEYLNSFHSESDIIKEFPLVSPTASFNCLPDYLQKHLDFLLANDDISLDDFKKSSFSFGTKKLRYRKTFISLEDFQFQIEEEKVIVRFSLPKSTYATMIIREITGDRSI